MEKVLHKEGEGFMHVSKLVFDNLKVSNRFCMYKAA